MYDKRIMYTYVDHETVLAFIRRARNEDLCDDRGQVDVSMVLEGLIRSYADGVYFIRKSKNEVKVCKDEMDKDIEKLVNDNPEMAADVERVKGENLKGG